MRTIVILLIAMVIPVMGMSDEEYRELGRRAFAEEREAARKNLEEERKAKAHPGYEAKVYKAHVPIAEPNSIPASVFAKPKPESEFMSMVKLLLAVGMATFFLPLVALGVLILGPCMIFIWVRERRKKPKSTITKDTYYKTLIDTLEDQ